MFRDPSARAVASLETAFPAEHPKLILLDKNLKIIAADQAAIELASNGLQLGASLLDQLKSVFAEVTPEVARRSQPTFTMGPVLLRVTWVEGAAHSYYAVFVELRVQLDNLRDAMDRYALTKREIEVLALIIRGNRGSEIARALCISPATVNDHFKSLRRKTGARSRSEMLIKILGRYSAVVGDLP